MADARYLAILGIADLGDLAHDHVLVFRRRDQDAGFVGDHDLALPHLDLTQSHV
jgi:hypothetical protein